MVTEYSCWKGDKEIKKNSLVELRKAFIQKDRRNGATTIFKKGRGAVGRLYCGIGVHWFYNKYENNVIYEINEDGTVKR